MYLSYGQQKVLERRARHVGRLAPRFCALLAGYAAVVVLNSTEPIPRWVFALAAFSGFVVLASYLLMLLHTCPSAGAVDARDRSRELLARVPGWHAVDDVQLGRVDVDHVVATPNGLLAVDTKWRLGSRDGSTRDLRHNQDLSQAALAARKIRRLTESPPNAVAVPVLAVLLLWGPGTRRVPTGWDEIAGVYVLDGNEPWAWPVELAAATSADPSFTRPMVDAAFRKVSGWAAQHRRSVSRRRVMRIVLTGVRLGWMDREHPVSRSRRKALAHAAAVVRPHA